MAEEFFKLLSIAIGRILLGGIGYVFRWIYYRILRRNKKLSLDDYENKAVAFVVMLIFFISIYFNFIS